jgi:ribosomal protein S18 acetylase RimI-like enzyme
MEGPERGMRIEHLGPGDDGKVEQASALFDGPALAAATRRFLDQAGHHLLVAYEDDDPAGFVTGVELTHPDKGTEMFLYELGVAERYRRRGIARALVAELARLAEAAGCYGMWVLTDDQNHAALATYRAAGGTREPDTVMISWEFPGNADQTEG